MVTGTLKKLSGNLIIGVCRAAPGKAFGPPSIGQLNHEVQEGREGQETLKDIKKKILLKKYFMIWTITQVFVEQPRLHQLC